VAWLMPGVYLLAGAGLVVFVIGRWRKRGGAAETAAANSKTITPAMLERARAAAQKATEE